MNLKQYYKSITKYPVSSGLNILSLVIAFLGIITILLYVSYHKSFDTYNKNYKSIYKLQIGKDDNTIPAVIAPIVRKNIPEVEALTPTWSFQYYVSLPDEKNKDDYFGADIMYANNDIFDIFSLKFLQGNPKNALTKGHTTVLSQSLANKIFGKQNPIGKKVMVGEGVFTVTGVFADLPPTSSMTYEMLLSFQTLLDTKALNVYQWSEWSYNIYLKTIPNQDPEKLARKIDRIEELDAQYHIKENNKAFFNLLPLKELHFTQNKYIRYVNKTVLSVLLLLALVLALMALINFVNLQTSQAIQRSKVFSMKRILGANRPELIRQLLFESILIVLFSLAITLLLHSLLYPKIEAVLQIDGLNFKGRTYWIYYFVLMSLAFAIAAGIYPARYITSANVVQSIKGAYRFTGNRKTLRNILLVLQFTFTIALIIGSIAINKQISYWHNFDTGIQTDNKLFLYTTPDVRAHKDAFAKELMKNPHILDYTYTQFVPGSVEMSWGRKINGQQINLYSWPVDERFIDFFDIKITKGRKFSKNPKADENSFIVNEAAVKKYNWDKPTEMIMPGFGFDGPIVGVAENFNYASLKESITPMIFWRTDTRPMKLILKIDKTNPKEIISYIDKIWNKYEHKTTLNYRFLDQFLQKQYEREEKIALFIEGITLWSILLSLTGLLGLALFVARQRTKEIGIRKTNGATVNDILLMINKDFIKWILIAFVIAVPIAYYAIDKWLENFAYHTQISWWIFALAGLLTLIIAVVAVSVQSYKVARKNPVESLKYE